MSISTFTRILIAAAVSALVVLGIFEIVNGSYVNRSASRVLSDLQLSNYDFAYSLSTFTQNVVAGGTHAGPINDIEATTTNTGSDLTSCTPHATSSIGSVSYRTNQDDIATSSTDGTLHYVSDGTVNLIAMAGKRSRILPCDISQTFDYVTYSYIGITPGSLADLMHTGVENQITGKNATGTSSPATTTVAEYSTYNDGTHTYVRNSNFFLKDVDLTMVPVNVNDQGSGRGFLVAPDTALSVIHAGICPRSGVYHFVTSTSTTVTMTIATTTDVGNTDICVVHFTSSVPPTIKFAKVIPYDTNICRISSLAQAYKIAPLIFTGRMVAWHVGVLSSIGSGSVGVWDLTHFGYTDIPAEWYTVPISGDSGNPVMAIINGEAVAVGLWFAPTTASGIVGNENSINAIMTAQGSPYQLTQYSTSTLPNYCQ